MAARGIGKIARLTLFSGPQCSLCDIAKAELAKVRRQRSFELETINIQDPGQERWKNKYVYWIPALHIEGKEVAKGRWDAQTVNQALDTLYDTPLYHRIHALDVLGDSAEVDERDLSVTRCFNCGVPGHVVSKCSEPVDRRVVALTRQYYEFFRKEPTSFGSRIHEVQEWRQERLQWLDKFEPGQIRGPILRDALGLQDGDVGERVPWLPYIAKWGYPPGWVGSRDPREAVWKRIHDGPSADSEDEDDSFYIFADGEAELCQLDKTSFTTPRAPTNQDKRASDVKPFARWAVYPDTYFLPSELPIYTGQNLNALRSRGAYRPQVGFGWPCAAASSQCQPRPPVLPIPPWRLSGKGLSFPEMALCPMPTPPYSEPHVGVASPATRNPLSTLPEDEADLSDMDTSD